MNNIYVKEGRLKQMVKGLLCAALFIVHSSLFISVALLVSCSDDTTDVNAPEFSDILHKSAYTDDQIQMQRLGYAYNAAGNVMDDSSFSVKPIINMERLEAAESEYGLIINSERRHYTSMDIFSGNTLQEMGHEESKYTLNESDDICCGQYYKKSNKVYHNEWKNCYKAHMFIKHIMATRTIDVGILRCLKLDDLNNAESVLEDDFRKAVAELVKAGEGGIDSAKATKFSEKYGTHVVVSSNLGGMIELQMEINRDSCVDRVYTTQQVTEIILGKQVTNTTNSKVISEISDHHIQYQGEVKVKGGTAEDTAKLHRTFDHKKAEAVKIADGDYYAWATHISIEPDNYNAAFIGGRYVPLYELFENATTRIILRKVYEMYLKQEAPTQEVYEPDYGIMPVAGNYGPDVRVAVSGNNKACIVCQEYVPSIRSDKPCVVVYPLLRDINGDARPFFYSGLFVGDESHRPGRVIWKGSASVYTPNDSIFYESDSTAIHNLFDPKTHALKNVYFYWNAVHPQPCPTKTDSLKTYTTTIFKAQPRGLAESTTFAKVASTFWSVRPVHLKTDSILSYWEEDPAFVRFKEKRYNLYDGVLYKIEPRHPVQESKNDNYWFCLMDGGNNIKRTKERTNDPDANLRWTDAVSMSMKALGVTEYLPSVYQSKSITKMLGNRMSLFYERESNGRNMLGLDWPTGYWVISHPTQNVMAVTPTQNDGQGLPIITNDAGQARIMRLSGSGTDLLLEFPEYVRSFNYSDQQFFKFFPIYITVDTF